MSKKKTTKSELTEPLIGLVVGIIMMIVAFLVAYYVFDLVPFS
ncbi:hypothetical protein [Halalkalibacter krulwichiae]|uniref:Uncharacterized protein n=1 Tax=Halalkalibacter krulwichiae TaxID=199441 RepID=A0A1X9MKV9_9BACI|nr:hypothetical protein [Halalkalibacter krulwichiae]ARK31332.1 hypothetical protein BkAM31D_16550 [Halalkalibacter krulwichiae]